MKAAINGAYLRQLGVENDIKVMNSIERDHVNTILEDDVKVMNSIERDASIPFSRMTSRS